MCSGLKTPSINHVRGSSMNLLKRYKTWLKTVSVFTLFASLFVLSGCQDAVLINSKGAIGIEQRDLIYKAVGLMLIVVIPAILLSVLFAWKYRAANAQKNEYKPDWEHSNKIEFVVWTIPLIIIVILGTITWKTAFSLHPYKPIEHEKEAMVVEVVSLDWKWMFIYPEQGIATINELAIPVDRPIEFKLTSDSVMNSFFIPQLGGQIYVMAGMQTRLHLIANEVGEYKGISASYSGAGFSGMKFKTLAKTDEDFNAWVQNVKSTGSSLDNFEVFKVIAKPSENAPVAYFNNVVPDLFRQVVMQYSGEQYSSSHDGHNAPSAENHDAASHSEHSNEAGMNHNTAQ